MFSKDKDDKEEKGGGFASLLLKTRTVLINGEVDHELAEHVIAQAFVTSQGGHVDPGFAIHDMLRCVESRVITIGTGWVASIAVPILFGAAKEDRYSLPNTRFLLHQPSGGAGGPLSDIRIEAREIIKLREKINQMIADETGQPVDKVASDSDRNFWMNAEEALEYGIISRIITNMGDLKLG